MRGSLSAGGFSRLMVVPTASLPQAAISPTRGVPARRGGPSAPRGVVSGGGSDGARRRRARGGVAQGRGGRPRARLRRALRSAPPPAPEDGAPPDGPAAARAGGGVGRPPGRVRRGVAPPARLPRRPAHALLPLAALPHGAAPADAPPPPPPRGQARRAPRRAR